MELLLTEAQAVLQIGTTPFNAAVIVDGRVKGKSPMALELPPGEYDLRLELAGHVPVARTVVLTLDEPTRIDAILEPGGTLEFEGLSGETRITLDGAPAVPDGDALFIAAGPHQVELTREGYFPRLEPVIVVAGETVTLDASMKPTLSTRQAMAAGAHDAWVWKWGLSYGVAAVAGILMLQDVQALLASNDKQDKLTKEAESAATEDEFNAASDDLASESNNGDAHADSALQFFLVAVALSGLGTWIYMDEPADNPVSLRLLPMDGQPHVALQWKVRW